MDAWLFHPKLVHVPMALGVLMPLIAGGLLFAWWRALLPARAWVLAIALQVVLVASGIMALRSGEAEEEVVEGVVPERFIEAHEEAAEAFVWSSGAVLGVMLLALGLSSGRGGKAAALAATAGTVVVLGLGYQTGQAGGELVYRHGAGQAYLKDGATTRAASMAPASDGEDDD